MTVFSFFFFLVFFVQTGEPDAVDHLMSSLDQNADGELTFCEFWQLIGKLAGKQGGYAP